MSLIPDLKKIVSPQLTDANFGEGVRSVFDNIDENFRKISTYDYVKGEEGQGVWMYSYDLSQDIGSDGHPAAGSPAAGILAAATAEGGDTSLKDLLESGVRQGHVLLLYSVHKDAINISTWKEDLIGSLPWVFLDARYSNVSASGVSIDDYDLSGVAVWNTDLKAFSFYHPFPTLYWSRDAGAFCWKVNGNLTGLVAQGPKGTDGTPGNIVICRTSLDQRRGGESAAPADDICSGTYKITYYLTGSTGGASETDPSADDPQWVPVEHVYDAWEGASAIVFQTESGGYPALPSQYWISTIRIVDQEMVVALSQDNAVTTDFDYGSFIGVMNEMFMNDGTGCFYVPTSASPGSSTPSHIITAAAPNLPSYNESESRETLIMARTGGQGRTAAQGLWESLVIQAVTSEGTWTPARPADDGNGVVWTNAEGTEQVVTGPYAMHPSSIGGNPVTGMTISVGASGDNKGARHMVLGYNVAVDGDLWVSSISGARITEAEIDDIIDSL